MGLPPAVAHPDSSRSNRNPVSQRRPRVSRQFAGSIAARHAGDDCRLRQSRLPAVPDSPQPQGANPRRHQLRCAAQFTRHIDQACPCYGVGHTVRQSEARHPERTPYPEPYAFSGGDALHWRGMHEAGGSSMIRYWTIQQWQAQKTHERLPARQLEESIRDRTYQPIEYPKGSLFGCTCGECTMVPQRDKKHGRPGYATAGCRCVGPGLHEENCPVWARMTH
jgi:hypothetical protein